ncbi:MAG: NUDIX domain-containing protein [Peptococcaceae bacterium]|nr:NUDIX domain-containing protein [Candidatus Syntrophopropionicum ammoniitolerans]
MMNFKHKLMAVIQHVVIVSRSGVLLLRYSRYQGQGVEGLWGLPGGHYISGDPITDLKREVKEETGLRLGGSPRLLKNYVVKFPDGVDRYGVLYLYKLGNAARPAISLSNEHTEYLWAGRLDLEVLSFISPYQRLAVEETLDSLNIINF